MNAPSLLDRLLWALMGSRAKAHHSEAVQTVGTHVDDIAEHTDKAEQTVSRLDKIQREYITAENELLRLHAERARQRKGA